LILTECIDKKQDHAVTLLNVIQCIEKENMETSNDGTAVFTTWELCQHKESTSLRMKMTSKLRLPPLLFMMMTCLYPNGREKIDCYVLGHCDAYATIDDAIFTTEAQADEYIVREVRNKGWKHYAGQQVEDKEEAEEEEKTEVPIPTVSEALEAIRVVNRFYEASAGKNYVTNYGR
jgi:hypothetical protein